LCFMFIIHVRSKRGSRLLSFKSILLVWKGREQHLQQFYIGSVKWPPSLTKERWQALNIINFWLATKERKGRFLWWE
jgi:hypothetical protein